MTEPLVKPFVHPINDELMRARFFPNEFSPEECQQIREMPSDADLTRHYLQIAAQDMPVYTQNGQFRCELLPYVSPHQWLFDRLGNILQSVNQSNYHFELDQLVSTQRVNFGPNDYLDWHLELGEGLFSLRKLSLVLFLSPPSDYTGGKLEIGSSSQRHQNQSQGSLLIFPAYFMTRIHAVQSGEMAFLQTWVHGKNAFA
ncbi:MAG: 2OG-Fe(II) oxygenase family protein [Candidatus Sericytochromatia bacterium]